MVHGQRRAVSLTGNKDLMKERKRHGLEAAQAGQWAVSGLARAEAQESRQNRDVEAAGAQHFSLQ